MMEFLGDERTRASQACKGAFTILSFGMGVGDEAGADCTIMDEPSRVPSLIFFGFSLGIASARSVFGWDLLDRWSKGISVYILRVSDVNGWLRFMEGRLISVGGHCLWYGGRWSHHELRG